MFICVILFVFLFYKINGMFVKGIVLMCFLN